MAQFLMKHIVQVATTCAGHNALRSVSCTGLPFLHRVQHIHPVQISACQSSEEDSYSYMQSKQIQTTKSNLVQLKEAASSNAVLTAAFIQNSSKTFTHRLATTRSTDLHGPVRTYGHGNNFQRARDTEINLQYVPSGIFVSLSANK